MLVKWTFDYSSPQPRGEKLEEVLGLGDGAARSHLAVHAHG